MNEDAMMITGRILTLIAVYLLGFTMGRNVGRGERR